MGYRFDKKEPRDIIQGVYDVRNGATMKIAFGCFYLKHHDKDLHDHYGWPHSGHVDRSCQQDPFDDPAPWVPEHMNRDFDKLEPIDLEGEGYDSVFVTFDDQEIAEATTVVQEPYAVDPPEPNVIRLKVTPMLESFTGKPKETPFTVFAKNTESGVTDAICHGILKVLPSTLGE